MALRIWTIGIGLTAGAVGVAVVRCALSASRTIELALSGF